MPKEGLPANIFVSAHGDAIPPIAELEASHAGIAIVGCSWYVDFEGPDPDSRQSRRRSVLAAHLANQILSFGRGDSAQYHYWARQYAARAEPRRLARAASRFWDLLWGYGYKPVRLLRAGLVANALFIVLYFVFLALGWGHLTDGDSKISEVTLESVGSCAYYSVVVATTLGFGDILPHGACRLVLVLQLLTNVILVAMWLSSLTSPHREWTIPEDTLD